MWSQLTQMWSKLTILKVSTRRETSLVLPKEVPKDTMEPKLTLEKMETVTMMVMEMNTILKPAKSPGKLIKETVARRKERPMASFSQGNIFQMSKSKSYWLKTQKRGSSLKELYRKEMSSFRQL